LEAVLEAPPSAVGYCAGTWTLPLMVRFLVEQVGAPKLHIGNISRRLRARDWRRLRPRLGIVRADPRREENPSTDGHRGGKKGALAADPEALILYEDEMDLDWNPRITRVWAKRGRPMRVMTPGQNEKKTVFGAVSVAGKVYYSIQARKRAVNFLAFLEHVLQRVAKAGQHVLLILDHYGIHTAKTVERFVAETEGRLRPSADGLPSYCPDDNPQEKVWSHLQRTVLHNCYHHSLAEREAVTRRHLARLQRTGCFHLFQT